MNRRCRTLVPFVAVALASFDGRVLDRTTGQPLPSVHVSVGSRTAVTKADGRFVFRRLPTGATSVGVESDDVPPARTPLTLHAGANHRDLRACSTTLDYSCAKPEPPPGAPSGGAGAG